ncbi:fatty acid oxidation complex subunit alpha FadB, partial [Pseudoalteromonas sp. S1612]
QSLSDCAAALKELSANTDIKGMIYTSDKAHFIIGADIFEFLPTVTMPEAEFVTWLIDATAVFDGFAEVPLPTPSVITVLARGGGCAG